MLTVKGNQPRLRAAIIDRLGDHPQPARTRQLCRAHARTEERRLNVVPATAIEFPGAQQVFQIIRYTGGLDGQRTRNSPAVLAALRNVVTTALRLTGTLNIAAAQRAATLNPHTVLRLFTRTPKRDKPPL